MLREEKCGGESHDTGADNRNVDCQILGEARLLGDVSCRQPDGAVFGHVTSNDS